MFLLVGTITVLTLSEFQVGQLDDRLSAANDRFVRKPPPVRQSQQSELPSATEPPPSSSGTATTNSAPSPGSTPGSEGTQGGGGSSDLSSLFSAGQSVKTIAAQIVNGTVTKAAILEESAAQPLPASVQRILEELPAGGRDKKYTRDLGELGTYRLIAKSRSDGEILVTGLPMDEVLAARYQLIGIELVVGLAALLILTFAGAAVIRVALAPLTRVATTAQRVSSIPLHEGEVGPLARVPAADTDPRSEAGQVGAAFNRMLDHVASALAARQASETRLRQFVADASHELRTPLAAIRGYTELTRRHRLTTPLPVGDALDRVEAAASRMTTLVEDLLLLARLDAKRPLERQQVDLSAIVIEATTDAHVAGPGHRWLLDLPEDSISTVGDRTRLHQVFANLLANARTHTPPGTTVTVSMATIGDQAAIRVMDNGQGISPELVPRLFERFARGDSSRSRSTGSTGLGLAIVDAVTTAHGGRVEVTSVPGCTAFVVWLPLIGEAPGNPGLERRGSGRGPCGAGPCRPGSGAVPPAR
ncbi:MAG: HAMP domain-containing histidine kinase [Micromonosporaceae bacterium]|nr:HAMP domain-containing histidine kinase [Micromonosporaceae bacterium]